MNKFYFLSVVSALFLFSCSGDDGDMGTDISQEIIGSWKLDKIRVEGADCKTVFGDDVPDEYVADAEGCASPDEILGNSSRCINLEFRANGVGTFFWSEITGQEDADITYSIANEEVEYCFEGSLCSGSFRLVGNNLESEVELRLDEECKAIFVLRRN